MPPCLSFCERRLRLVLRLAYSYKVPDVSLIRLRQIVCHNLPQSKISYMTVKRYQYRTCHYNWYCPSINFEDLALHHYDEWLCSQHCFHLQCLLRNTLFARIYLWLLSWEPRAGYFSLYAPNVLWEYRQDGLRYLWTHPAVYCLVLWLVRCLPKDNWHWGSYLNSSECVPSRSNLMTVVFSSNQISRVSLSMWHSMQSL